MENSAAFRNDIGTEVPQHRSPKPAPSSELPTPLRFSPVAIAVRLFLTCWLVFALHFTTNIVREIYPALSLGDHLSFRVDEYAGMHPDIFELEGRGWYIANNPGASMVAAIPYTLARPLIDRAVAYVMTQRASGGQAEPPAYDSPWPMAREFYAKAWRRGLDLKFALAAGVTQWFCMAPSSALAVVVMFFLLRLLFRSDRVALLFSLLYAFGTPVFFRTGFLNHNLMLGHFAFFGFVTMWNPSGNNRWPTRVRSFVGGLTGGAALLFDYSGVIFLGTLFMYCTLKRLKEAGSAESIRQGAWYVMGSIGPIALLWFYQWRSFGHPLYPAQHWMAPVQWIEMGYQGYSLPQLDLLLALAFDYRYGLFVVSPILLLGVLYPLFSRGTHRLVPGPELALVLVTFVALWAFFSGVNYTRLQFNTGMRYLAPILPFLFVPTAALLSRLRPWLLCPTVVLSVTLSWPMAMYRDVESGFGVLNPILRTFLGGFQLPILTTVSNLPGQFGSLIPNGVSPLPLFALAAAIIYSIWSLGLHREGNEAEAQTTSPGQ